MRFAEKLFLSLLTVFLLTGCQAKMPSPKHFSNPLSVLVNEPVVPRDSLKLQQNLGLVLYRGAPFTGVASSCYHNGQLAETMVYIKGKKNGSRKKWFQTGLLSYQAFYQSNRLHGEVKSWWSNGNLRSSSNFQHGVAHGIQKQWYTHGQLFKEMHLNNGQEEGIQRAWRENGKLFANYQAKNGRTYGLKRANLCYELSNENILSNE